MSFISQVYARLYCVCRPCRLGHFPSKLGVGNLFTNFWAAATLSCKPALWHLRTTLLYEVCYRAPQSNIPPLKTGSLTFTFALFLLQGPRFVFKQDVPPGVLLCVGTPEYLCFYPAPHTLSTPPPIPLTQHRAAKYPATPRPLPGIGSSITHKVP